MKNTKSAIAKLVCGEAQGTAFLISTRLAVTASHCIIDAYEKNDTITLTFNNIPEQNETIVNAKIINTEILFPISIIKLDKEINSDIMKLACMNDNLCRKTKLLSYGYPHIKGEEGYPIDLLINDYLSDNVAQDGDVTFLFDASNRLDDFRGMSGSPVIFKQFVIGTLIEQSVEKIGNNSKVVDIKMVSNRKIKEYFDSLNIEYRSMNYQDISNEMAKAQQPKEYKESKCNYDEQRKSFKENNVITYSELDGIIKDYERSIEAELESIFLKKNKGNLAGAWEALRSLTYKVRSSTHQQLPILARLYYIQACWYLDDYADCGKAQKFINKVLEINPEYDCRSYQAKKYIIDGNILDVKEILNPIDNVSILNTYLQICIHNREIDDAHIAYECNKHLSNSGTEYLMSLICILEGEYKLAHTYVRKANEMEKNIPLHIMMEGVILYWNIVPSSMRQEDCILPPMYASTMILLNDNVRGTIQEITDLYKKAYELAKNENNTELQKEILSVWLNTISISDEYRNDGCTVANMLLGLEEFQCQAIMYLYMTGGDIPIPKNFDPSQLVQKKGHKIDSMLACIYLLLANNDRKMAYKKIKEYRFKFDELCLMEYWFELAIRSCDESNELLKIQKSLDESEINETNKNRLQGVVLEVLGEYEKLIIHAKMMYETTGKEIDLLNLITCYEKKGDWCNAELFCLEWKEKYDNPLADIKIVRCLALQNNQEKCLDKISSLRHSGKEECLTNEVLFYEIQAYKILGKYTEAIENGKILWERNKSINVLLLLAESYFLNMEDQEAIFVLKDGIRNGVKKVEVYQTLAEYNKRVSINEVEKYIKKALILSDNDPKVMMWAMNLLYAIGKSDKANEIFAKLRALEKFDGFKTVSLKEAREFIEKAHEETQRKYKLYHNCQCPYHVLIDHIRNVSYTLLCQQSWDYKLRNDLTKSLLLTSFGGRNAFNDNSKISLEEIPVIDFSTIVLLKHFGLLDVIQNCWDHIIISGNINNIITFEQNNCTPNQPDVIKKDENMICAWKRASLNYLELPAKEILNDWMETGILVNDIIPYKLAESNGLILISDHFTSDLLEESDKIPSEMREKVLSTYDFLTLLEERKDITTRFKDSYEGVKNIRKKDDFYNSLLLRTEKLPILVDENFLRTIYDMDGIEIISQKCEIYVRKNIFDPFERQQKNILSGEKAYQFLEEMKSDIHTLQEEGFIKYYGMYPDDNKKKNGLYTNDLLDLIHYITSKEKTLLFCDDRWINSCSNLGKCHIFSGIDIIELLHDQNIITDEKYVNIITRLFDEGYTYIVPPVEYIKILINQISDRDNIIHGLPDALNSMCNYLVYVSASDQHMSDEIVINGVLPESVGYMYNIQKNLIKVLKFVWEIERTEIWKRQVSNWLLSNYSVFVYSSAMNRGKFDNEHYYELELANFIFSGFKEISGGIYRKSYYKWLFSWLQTNVQWKNELQDKTIGYLVELIEEIYRKEKNNLYKNIGVGWLVMSVTDDMPGYYKNLIRTNSKIVPIINDFENNYVFMGEQDCIRRDYFNKWLEDAMNHGINNEISRYDKKTNKQYRIVFIEDVLYHQGFRIEFLDNKERKHVHYFRIDCAKLMCSDSLLRVKGLYALQDMIDSQDMKDYHSNIHKKEWENIVNEVVENIANSKKYVVYILRYILQHKNSLISVEELLQDRLKLFSDIIKKIQIESIQKKLEQGLNTDNQELIQIHGNVMIFVYSYLQSDENYRDFTEENCLAVASFGADLVLEQLQLLKDKMIYSLKDISEYLFSLNKTMGFFEEILSKNKSIAENNHVPTENFINPQCVKNMSCKEMLEFYKKYSNLTQLHDLQPVLKEWIICNDYSIEENEEADFLHILEYYSSCFNNNSDMEIDNYLDLWESLIDMGKIRHLSSESIYLLRRLITVFTFEQGIRMRKIIEKLSLGEYYDEAEL